MNYIFICLISILWLTVATLCVNSLNEFADDEDEWNRLSLWARLPLLIIAPALLLVWSR